MNLATALHEKPDNEVRKFKNRSIATDIHNRYSIVDILWLEVNVNVIV